MLLPCIFLYIKAYITTIELYFTELDVFLFKMAKLISLFIAVATGLLVLYNTNTKTHVAAVAPAPAPEVITVKYVVPPEPRPGFYKYIELCLRKITTECGAIIYYNDYSTLPLSVSETVCCKRLVAMGRPCHEDMYNITLKLPELRYARRASVRLLRSSQMWDACLNDTESPPELGW